MSESLYRRILNEGNFVGVRKEFIKELGASQAVLLSELIKKENDLAVSHMLSSDGLFYFLVSDIQECLAYSVDKIYLHIKAFESLGVLTIHRRGQPPKNWYKLNYDKIVEIINNSDEEDEDAKKELSNDNRIAWNVWNSAHPEDPIYPGSRCCIHHKDLNHENNELSNLQKMTVSDHSKLHASLRKKKYSDSENPPITTEEKSRFVLKNESIEDQNILEQYDLVRSTDAEASNSPPGKKKSPELKEEMKQLFLEVLPAGEFTNRPIEEGKPVAKLYLEVQRFLTLLPDPKAFAHAYEFDQEWMTKEKIDLNYFEGRAIEPLVRRAAKRFALMRKVGYEPEKKSILTKYIQDFFYNSQQKKSWFLFCCFHEPVEINRANKDLADLAGDDRAMILKHKPADWSEKDFLLKAVKLLKWYRKTVSDLQVYNYYITDGVTPWQTRFSDFDSFLGVIDEYSKTWKEWTIGNFGLNNGTWDYFVKWCRDTFKVELDPSLTEVKEAMKMKEREDKRSRDREVSREEPDSEVEARQSKIRDELLAELEREEDV